MSAELLTPVDLYSKTEEPEQWCIIPSLCVLSQTALIKAATFLPKLSTGLSDSKHLDRASKVQPQEPSFSPPGTLPEF